VDITLYKTNKPATMLICIRSDRKKGYHNVYQETIYNFIHKNQEKSTFFFDFFDITIYN